MKQALKKAFTQNIGLKFLALVFSFALWLVVVNVDDPTQTRTFTAVVSVTNESSLTSQGKLYEIRDGINTVTFRVTAKRSIIEKLSSSDFSATADMNYLESDDRIPVTITAKSYANFITISSKQNYLYVNIEDEASKKFVVTAETTGTLGTDLAIQSVEASPNVITISGPEEKVSQISTVKAAIDITGVTTNITENVIPVLYDADGKEMDTSKLNLSSSTVSVSVDFANLKTVEIEVNTSGSLSEHLTLGAITTDPATVTLQGTASALNEITAITIPGTVINLSTITGSCTTSVDISAYLPDGVSLVDSSQSKITIYVMMQDEESSTITYPVSKLIIENLPDDRTAQVSGDSLTVTVFGTADAIEALDTSQVTGVIDCSGLTEGEQSAIVHFTNTDDVTIQNCTVTITISAKEATVESNDSTGDTTEGNED